MAISPDTEIKTFLYEAEVSYERLVRACLKLNGGGRLNVHFPETADWLAADELATRLKADWRFCSAGLEATARSVRYSTPFDQEKPGAVSISRARQARATNRETRKAAR